MALELLDGELLGEFFDLRVRLGDAHAHSEEEDDLREDADDD